MAVKKGGLGRGLESLFEDAARDVGGPVSTLPLREIEPDKDQPRKDFDEQALSELADSIARHGLLQPIAVRAAAGGAYKIIAGERRWRAARLAGLSEVPVVIKDVTDAEAMELALIENLQREDLDPVEEAMGYRQLMERCELTQEQTAQKIGKSRSAIANSLRLLNLPEDVLTFLKEGKLSTGHAKVLLGLPDAALQSQAAEAVVGQNLNVRQTEALCKKLVKPEKPAKPQPLRPALAGEVEYALRQVLGSEVKVDYKNGQGSLTVHFYSDEQLSAFANLLGGYNKEENK
ncbi:MAG TPA: ParB/RepB/Spo0J family partition protein [Candidatus Fournierella merdipullorum]|uniref:ParB/RepB/Spo0J family partition protein n=1 Tax=Candidatus Allofournierella merdipullorum TaxID=2838595 RepID=A0A9D2IZX8_9FIRM|nr:ParB/RepB/Spo0J family partition protein [Candidatus Fournierella merdipullorum]